MPRATIVTCGFQLCVCVGGGVFTMHAACHVQCIRKKICYTSFHLPRLSVFGGVRVLQICSSFAMLKFIFFNSNIKIQTFLVANHFLIISFASTFLVELARTICEPLINGKWDTIALASLTYFLL